jgi:hypothetical protein
MAEAQFHQAYLYGVDDNVGPRTQL